MEYVKSLIHVILGLELLEKCSGFPADLSSSVRRGGGDVAGVATPGLLAVALLAAAVSLLVGCACCGRRKGFRVITKVSPVRGANVQWGCPWCLHPETSWALPLNSSTQTESTANAATSTTLPLAQPGTQAMTLHNGPGPILTAFMGFSTINRCVTPCRSRVNLPSPSPCPCLWTCPRSTAGARSSESSSLSILETLCAPKEESCSSFVLSPVEVNHPHICVVQRVLSPSLRPLRTQSQTSSQTPSRTQSLSLVPMESRCPLPSMNLDNMCVTPLCVSERDLVATSRKWPPNRRFILYPPVEIVNTPPKVSTASRL